MLPICLLPSMCEAEWTLGIRKISSRRLLSLYSPTCHLTRIQERRWFGFRDWSVVYRRKSIDDLKYEQGPYKWESMEFAHDETDFYQNLAIRNLNEVHIGIRPKLFLGFHIQRKCQHTSFQLLLLNILIMLLPTIFYTFDLIFSSISCLVETQNRIWNAVESNSSGLLYGGIMLRSSEKGPDISQGSRTFW
jgi:hypothetical protein